VDNVTFTPTYTVYRNTTFVADSGAWSNNSVITVFLNGLGVGDWNYTIIVNDGNWTVSDEVIIHVLNVVPTITPHADYDMALGTTGNELTGPSRMHPRMTPAMTSGTMKRST